MAKGRGANSDAKMRLLDDGNKDARVRARIHLIAKERNLTPSQIKSALTLGTFQLKRFAEEHHLSCDWLLCGDLKGLLRQVHWSKPFINNEADPAVLLAGECGRLAGRNDKQALLRAVAYLRQLNEDLRGTDG